MNNYCRFPISPLLIITFYQPPVFSQLSLNVHPTPPRHTLLPQEAVRTLNTLQSNAVTLEKARLARGTKQLGIPETVELARRAGITVCIHCLYTYTYSEYIRIYTYIHNLYTLYDIQFMFS